MRSTPRPFPLSRAALALALAAALGLGGPATVRAEDGGHGGGPGPSTPSLPIGGVPSGGRGGPGPSGGVPVIGGVVSPFPSPISGRGGRGDGGSGDGGGSLINQTLQRGRDTLDGDGGGRGGRDSSGRDGGGDLLEAAGSTSAAATAALIQARQTQAQSLIRANPQLIEPDNLGRPVVRHEVLALAPSAAALGRATRAGFRVRSTDALPELGVTSVVLEPPRGVSAVEALRRLRVLDPQGQYDFNHLYQEGGRVAGRAALPLAAAAAAPPPAKHGVRVGLVDGGVAQTLPALSGSQIVQKGFAPGGPRPSAHGTAVASLIAGRKGVFRGAAPGASLYVADVYGATPTGGSAEAIAHALAWLAQSGVPVINISLVGPPNLLLEAAVKGLVERGRIVIAAVGNDGPAAPPLYPAGYPGVIAVTGVDPRWRILPEAGRGTHVDFAAPGSEMAAAGLDGGFVAVRGTSFAAPLAAGLLARLLAEPDRGAAQRAIDLLGRRAMDLGPRGPDAKYGRGLIAAEFRTPPGEVKARLALRGP
ncbi:MAG TPA: S8 family serine peptidase [Phenylobacterium sp.]|nr:S8 family serine peptidase [Phenylobacterium sp.]